MTEKSIRFGILTVSDRCSKGECEDKSGPALATLLTSDKHTVSQKHCVPDEINIIHDILKKWCDEGSCDVVLTTGGTGFGVRDVTPEATLKLVERRCDALAAAAALRSAAPLALLSRASAGIRASTLIVNLPGSVRGVTECYGVLSSLLPHAVALLRSDDKTVARDHLGDSSNVLISKVECGKPAERPRTSPYPMVSVEEAQNVIFNVIRNCTLSSHSQITEKVAIKNSVGRVLSEEALSKLNVPPFRASIKDGYAVLINDSAQVKKVIGISAAGSEIDVVVGKGECVRVNTGGPVPAGAEAVVQVEDTTVDTQGPTGEETTIRFNTLPTSVQDIRQVGSDLKEGQLLLPSGSVISATDVGLLASGGLSSVPCFRLPRVAVLSTGDEVVDVGAALTSAKIVDSNRPTLLALLAEHGFKATDAGIVPDQPNALLRKLSGLLNSHDVIITTGGVSMGDRDYLKQVLLQDLNATIHFGRVNMKPGKPTTFASMVIPNGEQCLLFCLPGNPASAFVTSHLFLLPALRLLSHQTQLHPPKIQVFVKGNVKLDERPEYKRVNVSFASDGSQAKATTTGNQISSRLASCQANGLLVLPSSSQYSGRTTDHKWEALLLNPISAFY